MSAVVPVQIEYGPATADACGTCTKCGKSASVALDPDDGGPVARRKAAVAAVAAVCAKLTALCEVRLPWGVAPAHEDRRIPKGVTLLAETSSGDRLPVAVGANGKLVTAWAGVHHDTVVMVVPDDEASFEAAVEFKAELVGRGYERAQTAPVGTVATPRKPAEVAS